MLSNAFRRSMNHACTRPRRSFCSCMSCSMTKAWVTHEWYFLKPAWFGDMMSLSSVCFRSLAYINLSITLDHMFVRDIGLCCVGFALSCLSLGIRNMLAYHSPFGTVCWRHISCTSVTVISHAGFPPYFSSSAVI